MIFETSKCMGIKKAAASVERVAAKSFNEKIKQCFN